MQSPLVQPLPRAARSQLGMVLLAVFVFILITTLAASAMVEVYQTQKQRENEEELLFVGDQYRAAIASYAAQVGTGGARRLPQSLNDLVDDHRTPTPRHHLRRLYPDPMTGHVDWILIQGAGGIAGVASSSQKVPFKKSGFPVQYTAFASAVTYGDWHFQIGQ